MSRSISFDKFDFGLDLRKGLSTSDANRLRMLKNAHATEGKTIRKRPGLTKIATLEAGTTGLFSGGGKLNTFYGGNTPISHANSLFSAKNIKHPTNNALAVSKVHYADVFNGYLYVSAEYSNGNVRHQYLDSPADWIASSNYQAASLAQPVTKNNFRYEVSSITNGVSSWPEFSSVTLNGYVIPTTPNGLRYRVSDVSVGDTVWAASTALTLNSFRKPTASNGYRYEVTTAGTTASVEPVWPTTAGATVVNGTVTFTCRNTNTTNGYRVFPASTALALAIKVRPTSANGFYYEVTTAGTTGASEPTWPTVTGQTVVSGTVTFTCKQKLTQEPTWPTTASSTVNDGGVTWICENTGVSGASEPTWPTASLSTVTDGSLVWTCKTFAIDDANCPNTKQVTKIASKIWAVGVNGDVVRFTKTNGPRDWTAANDAGFLPVSLQQSGANQAMALGFYQSRLVVFFPDAAQIWQVDVNPANHAFLQAIDVGSQLPYSHANMAGDVFFFSPAGVRSITRQDITTNLIDTDIGSPIDRELLKGMAGIFAFDIANARAQYYRGGGQYWLYSGTKAMVYTFSRTTGVIAWSLYEYPFSLDYMDELNAELYIRSGDNVYKVDRNVKTDDGTLYAVDIEMAFLDFKMPGILKHIHGMDAVVTGSCQIAHRFDARSPSLITDPPVTISGDSRPGYLMPVELLATNIAPDIHNYDDQEFELHQLTYYFESLAPL